MSRIITLFNQKGGVGKTTTCANVCASMAIFNKKVLAIDFDPQRNLTSGLIVERKRHINNIYNILTDDVPMSECIIETSIKNLDIIPGSIDLAGAEVEMTNMLQRETILLRALKEIEDKYEYILIDCPPSLGLLPINALAASTDVIIPIQCEYYALEGVSQLINTINLVKKGLNPSLNIMGVVLTMYDKRTNLSQQVTDEVKNYFSEKVFETIIPRNIRLAEAPSHGMSIIEYDMSSKGSQAYLDLTNEILHR